LSYHEPGTAVIGGSDPGVSIRYSLNQISNNSGVSAMQAGHHLIQKYYRTLIGKGLKLFHEKKASVRRYFKNDKSI